jgi:tetratricopeptide (TPR) repeat protein
MIIPALLLLQSATLPTIDEVRAADCQKLIETDPASAIVNASEWKQAKGNYHADACLGGAYAAQNKFGDAVQYLSNAAAAASLASDPNTGRYWTQAGNAAIAAGQSEAAISYLGKALGDAALKPRQKANILIDRARAFVAIGQTDNAATDLSSARGLSPDEAAAWLLSATLSRRTEKLDEAQNFIATAARLAPSDPAVALEAGNIAASAGAFEIARTQWQQAVNIAPQSPQANSASALLQQLGARTDVQAGVAKPKTR